MSSARDTGGQRHAGPQTGFSLIEVLAFIVIAGILGAALFTAFTTATRLQASASDIGAAAVQLAQERMELILGQRRTLGFAAFTATTFDPCTAAVPSTQPVCTVIPAGYTVGATLADNWGGDTNYKVITVAVTGPSMATLTALVANY